MWIKRKGCTTVNLKEVIYFYVLDPSDYHKLSWRIKFSYLRDSVTWSFPIEEERDDYYDWVETLVDAKEFEPDIIGKLN